MPQKRNRVKKVGIKIVPKEPLSPKERQWLLDLNRKAPQNFRRPPAPPAPPKPPAPLTTEEYKKQLEERDRQRRERRDRLSPRDKMKRELKKDKPKPKAKPPKRGDKKFKVEKPIYRGESLGKGKSSQEV